MGDISKNFSANEFKVSKLFPELTKHIHYTDRDRQKLHEICFFQAQPLRDWVKHPIIITSGKCTPELNEKLGRNRDTTEHAWNYDSAAWDCQVFFDGEAADYRFTKLAYYWATTHIIFGQLILYSNRQSIHISLPTKEHNGEYWIDKK